MKTLTISTLFAFTIACAPATDTNADDSSASEALPVEVEEMIAKAGTTMPSDSPEAPDDRVIVMPKPDITKLILKRLATDMMDRGCDVRSAFQGMFSHELGTFVADGRYVHGAEYRIQGDINLKTPRIGTMSGDVHPKLEAGATTKYIGSYVADLRNRGLYGEFEMPDREVHQVEGVVSQRPGVDKATMIAVTAFCPNG